MVKPTLLVLAAGMGSRYGSLKQMDGEGPNNEAIIDYSIYDAKQAGFEKVVFIINYTGYIGFGVVSLDILSVKAWCGDEIYPSVDLAYSLFQSCNTDRPCHHGIIYVRDVYRIYDRNVASTVEIILVKKDIFLLNQSNRVSVLGKKHIGIIGAATR